MSKRKAPSENPNGELCSFLTELAEYEKNVSRNVHKHNAYRKAASVLAALPTRVQNGDEAKKLNGIGVKIAAKIDEFLQTGKLKKLENIRGDQTSVAISSLTRISGIGPAKAKELVDSGYLGIEDLRKDTSKLNHHQQIGLKHLEDFEKPIPREEILQIEEKLKSIILKLDTQYDITICGSFRRGKSTSGDIDVLLTHPKHTTVKDTSKAQKDETLKGIVNALENANLVTDTISLGHNKFMGVCKLNDELPYRRLDIKYTPINEYHCAILYFTGSDIFNKTMRGHALEKGFTLNDHCLRPVGSTGVVGEPVEITCEQDIFDYIDFPYKKPEERNM